MYIKQQKKACQKECRIYNRHLLCSQHRKCLKQSIVWFGTEGGVGPLLLSPMSLLAQAPIPLFHIHNMCIEHHHQHVHHYHAHDPSERQRGQEAFQEFCQCNACDANVRLPAPILISNHKERESG